MGALNPDIRFAHAVDGVRIAHATTGSGYPLVRAAHWLGHLDYDWQTPVWRPWIDALSARQALRAMVSFTNLTVPSPMRTFTPPG